MSVCSWEPSTIGTAVCPRRKRGLTGVYVGVLMIMQRAATPEASVSPRVQ